MSGRMYNYSVYGLNLSSEIELPELTPSDSIGDVKVHLRSGGETQFNNQPIRNSLEIDEVEARLTLETLGTIMVRSGDEIIVYPKKGIDNLILKRYIYGTILAILLFQRGNLVLHAGSIEIDNKAVAFLGESGTGKSTIVAAFHQWGFGVISDDITIVHWDDNGTPIIYPGFPQLKLSDASAQSFGFSLDMSTPIGGHDGKRGYRLDHGFIQRPIELGAMFILGNNNKIQLLSPQEVVKELIKNTYPTRFAKSGNSNHFKQIINLANRVPAYRLGRAKSLSDMKTLKTEVLNAING